MAIQRVRAIGLGIVLATVLAGCGDSLVEGDGEVVTQTRVVEGFNAIRVTNGAEGIFTVDASTTGEVDLAITTDANLLEFVTTEVSNDMLRVSIDSGGEISSTQGFEITGTVGTLREVEANDGGETTITALLSAITLKADNAGRINGDALEVEDAEVEADNGASVTVCATGIVTGTVSNGADLVVLCGGNAGEVETANGGTVTTS